MTPAHTIVAQACLEVLLHLHENPTEDTLKKLPLAEYAARYWVGHARFENVSPSIEDQMKRLFDPKKPTFQPGSGYTIQYSARIDSADHNSVTSQGNSLALCGHINARDSQYHETPLEMASQEEHHDLEVSRVLLEYGALNQVPLIWMTKQEISRDVLEHSVGARSGCTHFIAKSSFDGIPLNESIFFGASVGSCVRALVSASPKLRAFLTVPIILLYSFAFLSNSYTLRKTVP
ncbi:hypothetical protein BC826DRAFT_1107650 [Russula brevipes]|nr:hypothetical protein BC826DRAFT_1107650 [Russula brevipes]